MKVKEKIDILNARLKVLACMDPDSDEPTGSAENDMWHCYSKEQMRDALKAVMNAYPGSTAQKEDAGTDLDVKVYLNGKRVAYIWASKADTCKLVGEEEEEYDEEIDDPSFEAPEIPKITVKKTRTVQKWDCGTILGAE